MSRLVAVGGTGQHVAISYLHLARLAGFDPVPVVVIDNDTTSSTATVLARLLQAAGLQRGQIAPQPATMASNTIRAAYDRDKAILDLLFESQGGSRGSEQDADVLAGFYGFPHLGATVSRALFEEARSTDPSVRQKSTLYQNLLQPLTQERVRRLGIAGSISGGCGSGVIPQLVDVVARCNSGAAAAGAEPGAGSQNAHIRMLASLELVAFELQGAMPAQAAGTPTAGSSRLVDRSVMTSNVVSGMLHFRRELEQHVDRVVFIAPPSGQLLSRENFGHRNQSPTPAYTHVISAVVQHLYFTASETHLRPAHGQSRCLALSTGPENLQPDHLPVPDAALAASGPRTSLPFAAFGAPLENPPTISGTVVTTLLPYCSLARWLWVSRVQTLLLDAVVTRIDPIWARFDGQYDLRDQVRNNSLVSQVKQGLAAQIDLLREGLDWMRSAFSTNSGGAMEALPGVGDIEGFREAVDGSDWHRWQTVRGKSFAVPLRTRLNDEFDAARIWRAIVGAVTVDAVVNELAKRARSIALDICDAGKCTGSFD